MEQQTLNESTNANEENPDKQQAFAQLAQGKRHLLVRDYDEAVTSFSEACRLFDLVYGPSAKENGEAYFNYGIALLELARSENPILGNPGGGGSDDSDDDADNDSNEDEKESKSCAENGNNTEAEKSGKNGDITVEQQGECSDETKGDAGNKDDIAEENGTAEEEEEEDDSGNDLRLAWNILELAKKIFESQSENNPAMKLKVADVYLKLAEISLEEEKYTLALEDLEKCLKIQTEYLEPDSRIIAETLYQIGLAYSLMCYYDEASSSFVKSMNIIEKNIDKLQEKLKVGLTQEEKDKLPAFYSIEEEIDELKALLPEIQEKVNDMKQFKEDQINSSVAEIKKIISQVPASSLSEPAASTSTATASTSGTSDKPASDITHLVRKKRKLDSETEEKNGGTSKQTSGEKEK